jgi:hypothetical protein
VPQTSAHFEPVAWWFTRKKIGRGLRERYEFAEDLPPRLVALIKELDGKSAMYNLTDRPRGQSECSAAKPGYSIASPE